MNYVVIGAGPAGLQLGYFLQRAGREYLIVEAGSTPGTFYRTFPRHRRMISINKPHTGGHDPRRTFVSTGTRCSAMTRRCGSRTTPARTSRTPTTTSA